MKKEFSELAEKYNLKEKDFFAALEEAFRLKLIDRTYTRSRDVKIDVDAYRRIFSKDGKGRIGLKQGGLGDRNFIKKKLRQWFAMNSEYTMQDVLNATQMYVNRFLDGDEDVRFLVRADYFIQKNGMSQLTSAVEEYVSNEKSLGVVKRTSGEDNWDKEIV